MSTALQAQTELGIFDGISNDAYHGSDGLSSSGLKYLAKSPAHFVEYKMNPPTQTTSMLIGSAVHGAVLEGHIESGKILKAPGSTRSTSLYKDFAKENAGKILLLDDEFEEVLKIRDSVLRHPVAAALLTKGKAEQSAFWADPETGVLCKCRPDFLRDDGLVIDLKTSQSASLEGFQRSIIDFKYHWQSAWYLDGLSLVLGKKLANFVHIVVENKAPYGISIFVLDDATLDKARGDIKTLLARYAHCSRTGDWPGYATGVQNISLPHWAFDKELV